MNHPKTLLTLTALAALLALGLVFQLPQVAAEDEDEGTTAAELIVLMKDVKVTLEDAVKAAKAKTGGTALDAEFEIDDDGAVFEVLLLVAKDTPHFVEVEIDARTGKVLEVENHGPNGEDDDDDEGDDDDTDGGEGDDS